MHSNNGTIRTFLHALKDLKRFDMLAFKKNNGDKPLSSFSMIKVEMLICESKTRILPFIVKEKKKNVVGFCRVWSEHQFLSKAPKSVQQNPYWRIQMWELRCTFERSSKKDHWRQP